jgi:tRNA threonylcarbamoyladenosine biosynthesis protein TsaE
MRQIVESFSEQETFRVGYRMGTECKRGDIVLLNGDLGVGKTVFTKGFGEGLGVKDTINSPTFTIMQIYETGRLPLYHFDVYRIGDLEEMEEIGYEDYFYGDGVCLIEWAELIQELLPDKVVKVTIEKELEKGFEYRKISIDKS